MNAVAEKNRLEISVAEWYNTAWYKDGHPVFRNRWDGEGPDFFLGLPPEKKAGDTWIRGPGSVFCNQISCEEIPLQGHKDKAIVREGERVFEAI